MIDKNEQRRRAQEMSQSLAAQGQVKPTLTYPVTQARLQTPRQLVAPQSNLNCVYIIPTGPKDMMGTVLKEGQEVARAMMMGRTPYIKLCKVTKVEGSNVYLDGSKQALRIPDRVVVMK